MKDNKKVESPWLWMLITFGMFMIMISPTRPNQVLSMFSGLITTLTGVLGLVLTKRKKRNRK